MSSVTSAIGRVELMTRQRVGSCFAMSREGAPQPLMISEIAVLETIPAGASAASPREPLGQPAGRG